MSHDLQWLLLRSNNSFLVRRMPEGPTFSKEPGNLLNIHSEKYSGLTNAKTIHIFDSGNGVHIATRKPKASPHAVKGAYAKSTIRNRSGGRRSSGVVSGWAKRGYRPDLRKLAVARASALLATQKEKKPTPAKKLRGKKRTAATASSTAMDTDE